MPAYRAADKGELPIRATLEANTLLWPKSPQHLQSLRHQLGVTLATTYRMLHAIWPLGIDPSPQPPGGEAWRLEVTLWSTPQFAALVSQQACSS